MANARHWSRSKWFPGQYTLCLLCLQRSLLVMSTASRFLWHMLHSYFKKLVCIYFGFVQAEKRICSLEVYDSSTIWWHLEGYESWIDVFTSHAKSEDGQLHFLQDIFTVRARCHQCLATKHYSLYTRGRNGAEAKLAAHKISWIHTIFTR